MDKIMQSYLYYHTLVAYACFYRGMRQKHLLSLTSLDVFYFELTFMTANANGARQHQVLVCYHGMVGVGEMPNGSTRVVYYLPLRVTHENRRSLGLGPKLVNFHCRSVYYLPLNLRFVLCFVERYFYNDF